MSESNSQRKKRLAREFNEREERQRAEKIKRTKEREEYYKSPQGKAAMQEAKLVVAIGAALGHSIN